MTSKRRSSIAGFHGTDLKINKIKRKDLSTVEVECKLAEEVDSHDKYNYSKKEVFGKNVAKGSSKNLPSCISEDVTFDGFQAIKDKADTKKKSMCPATSTPQVCIVTKKKLSRRPNRISEYASVNAASDAKDYSFINKENLQKHKQRKCLKPLRKSLQQNTLRMSVSGKNEKTKLRKSFKDVNHANMLSLGQRVTNNKTNQNANSEVLKIRNRDTLVEVHEEKNLVLIKSLVKKDKQSKPAGMEKKPKNLDIALENGNKKNGKFEVEEMIDGVQRLYLVRRSARIASLAKVNYAKQL